MFSMSFIQSSETMYYERAVYTVLDFLGDIGGLLDALCAIAKLFLIAFSYMVDIGPSSFIVGKLFKQSSSFQTNLTLLAPLEQ